MDKNNNQEMLMDWEKQLPDVIKETVDKIVENEKNKFNTSRPRKLFTKSYEKAFREEITDFLIYECRIKHTLNILEKCGLNIDKFKESSLYKSPRTNLMLEHIQGQIDGYDLSLIDIWNNDVVRFNVERRQPIGEHIDINNMQCALINNSLIIKSGDSIYDYHKDEHCLIYLNGDVVVTHKKVMTEDELYKYEKDLRKYFEEVNDGIKRDMAKADKIRVLSWELAGEKYYK